MRQNGFHTLMNGIFYTGLIITVIWSIIRFPAIKDYLTGDSVLVHYIWQGPNEVKITTNISSEIPYGYSIYVYRTEPDRYDGGFSIPPNSEWTYSDFASGWDGTVIVTVNHTEIIEAVCVRTGTDPTIAFTMVEPFDTSTNKDNMVTLECK